MTELLTAAQMRAIEQAAIDSGEVTGLELMERAGRGVVEAILDWRPKLATTSHRAVVLCGPGNNGGDGFVVARLLKQRGWEVDVFLYGDEAKLPPDATKNARRWREMGEIEPLNRTILPAYMRGGYREWPWEPSQKDILIDALFGIGLSRDLPDEVCDCLNSDGVLGRDGPIELLTDGYTHKHFMSVAVDLPSGLCSDSGKAYREIVPADLTVTFHRPKVGHLVGSGPSYCGDLKIVDIGL